MNTINDMFEAEVIVGHELQREGREEEAIAHFAQLVEAFPTEARAWFEYAGAFDSAGRELEAVQFYKMAMEMGLPDAELARAYLQLGSSLRNIAQHAGAVETLREGCARFPENDALRVFLAFALESAGQPREALTEMLELAIRRITSPEMKHYARAIRFYTDDRR